MTTETGKVHRSGILPDKDTDLGDVALYVGKMWNAEPTLTLKFTDSAAFNATVNEFRALLDTKNGKVSERRGITLQLAAIEEEITKGVRQVKGYLTEKYDTDAAAHYNRFGMAHHKKYFRLPADQSKKRDALLVMRNAIEAEGFGDRPYGTAFWQSTLDRFDALLTEARTLDGTVSGFVAEKNKKRDAIRRTLNAIILSLKAADPDNYEGELRRWGIQRDKF
ncbi:hypothetical protein [Flavobacterium sp. N1718]|nr:hypothetical protein [Flavobacterium sp. N1718]